MTTKSSDHAMLSELQKHLIIVTEATAQLTNARQKKKALETTLHEVKYTNKHFGNEPEYGLNVKAARQKYERDCKNKENEINHQRSHEYITRCAQTKRKTKSLFTLITLIGALIAIVVPIFLWLKTKFGYTFFMNHMWEGFLPENTESINLYCYILGTCIAVCIAFFLLGRDLDFFFSLFSIGLCGAILFDFVAACVALSQGWNVHGGWWVIAWIPAVFAAVLLPIVFILKILTAALISFVMLILILAIPVGLIYMWKSFNSTCDRRNPKPSSVSVPATNTDFKLTEAYRIASEKDRLQDEARRREYLEKVSILRYGLEQQCSSLITTEQSVILVLENAIAQSNAAIQACPIHDAYKTLQNVCGLLYYFEMGMADTFKEAANLMREDLTMQNLMNLLRAQHAETMQGMRIIITGIGKLDQATRTLANQWNTFAQQSERQHQALMNSLGRMESQQERLISTVRESVQNVQTSMAKGLNDLKTTYISSTNTATDRLVSEISSTSTSITDQVRLINNKLW